MDETIDAYITENYNMMDSSLIDQWNAYPEDMNTRMLQTAATVSCTHRFMFWPENKLDF